MIGLKVLEHFLYKTYIDAFLTKDFLLESCYFLKAEFAQSGL
jgi:hypothetical protein